MGADLWWVSSRLLTCLFLYTTHINTCYIMLLILTELMYSVLSTRKYQNIQCLVAIVDCTHVGSATESVKVLLTLHRRRLQQIF